MSSELSSSESVEISIFSIIYLAIFVIAYPKLPVLEHLSVNPDETDDIPTTAITVKELQTTVQNWMKNRHNVELHFNPLFAIDELSKMGLLKVKHLGKNTAGVELLFLFLLLFILSFCLSTKSCSKCL